MDRKTKILLEDGKYVGYILQNDEVVFQTDPCPTSLIASKLLTRFNQSDKANFRIEALPKRTLMHSDSIPTPTPPTTSTSSQPARKCCGRS